MEIESDRETQKQYIKTDKKMQSGVSPKKMRHVNCNLFSIELLFSMDCFIKFEVASGKKHKPKDLTLVWAVVLRILV